MKGKELTTDDVANKIAELILSQNYISKEDLTPKINAYLKAFVKVQSIPKLYPSDLKMTEVLRQKQQSALYNEMASYYASELCKVVGKENMSVHNIKAQAIRDAYAGNPIELINHAI